MSNKGSRKPNYAVASRQRHDHQESSHLLTPRIWWSSQKEKTKQKHRHKEEG